MPKLVPVWRRRGRLAGTIVGLAIVAVAGQTMARAGGMSASTLLDRMHAAYKQVPAAVVTVTGQSSEDGTFTEILRNGVVVAEQFVGSNASGTTMLVARVGAPTSAREPKTSCWRALAKSNAQTLNDTGSPFLSFLSATSGLSMSAPRSTAAGWVLNFSADGTSGALTLSKTLLVDSLAITHGTSHARESVDNLRRVPKLADPRPLC
jgi:hypothetical protein